MVKKDRQQNYYTIAYSKKYVTNILPDSLTKTTDAKPVYFTHNLFEPDKIRETSNDRTNRVSINHLLVNNLLPDRTFLSNSIAHKQKTRSHISLKFDRPETD
ncbi:hypothetical protein QUA35_23215 [Microcoleus sp. N9_B2]|uniref:hypothetical protein n=1 Tax=unclassified Microcoleus TaxID=2642155 RepID=UPI002FD3557F